MTLPFSGAFAIPSGDPMGVVFAAVPTVDALRRIEERERMGGSDDGADVGRGKDKKSDNGTERGCDVP